MTLLGMSAKAQQRNVLQVPDVTTQIGNVQLPISIENTDEIVGAQFDLTLPEGVTAEATGVMANRSDGHTVTMSRLSSGAYRVLLHSAQNRPLRGQSGIVMYLPINIPASFEEGSEHPLAVANAVLGKATGENLLTEAFAGSIRISKLPDLTVKNIICDKQTVNPGDRITCSWQVENIGELATGGGWSEQVSLVSEDGMQSKLIATTNYDGIIEASAIVSCQVEITLPTLLGIDGHARLQIRIVPDSKTGESNSAQGNNTQTSSSFININKVLTIELSPNRVDENAGRRIALRVNRSGRWAVAETFAITATADSRVSLPSSITIPVNQSGAVTYFSVMDNDVLDKDSIFNISVEGNGYAAVTSNLIIDDNELPSLSVTSSKTEVSEGETFQLTITTSRTSISPITVTLTNENARRFTFPQQAVIPAGEASVTVNIVAVDNDEIELPESYAFHASADKHERGECIVMLNDNDMPTLTFTLSPETVSESDGYAALFGVIKRTDNLDKRVTLKLSDDSNGLLTYTNQTVVMAKNQAEVQFNIGVTDNEQVDGNHVVKVTAAVYASSCDCSVASDSKGYMTATVTIIDDDGPTLKIKPAGTAMLEGSERNVFAVSHNVQSDADVTVHISSDKDDMLEYDHELTIPAGQSSAILLVNVKSNDQQDDSSIAAFKAEANGYSLGTCWILITDQTLPDAVVSLYADKTEVEAEQTVLLHAVVRNVGNSPLRSTTPIEISFSGRSEKVKLTVGKNIAVGDSAVIEYNYDLPAITGNHTFEAAVNPAGKVPELIYANNTSEKVRISIVSPFSVTAQAEKDVYLQDDSIHVTGKATGSAGKNANVEVYFINEGARQTVNATTDEEGDYAISWKPLSKQSGHFIVGACYPGSKATEEMDAFDVYGIRAKDNFKTCELSQTDSQSGKIVITNPGHLAQTGLKVTSKAESENCVFTYDVPASIGAGESVEIAYTMTGNEISEGRDWQQMPLEITTAEGSHLDYTIYYYVHSLKARLQTNQSYINTTMTYGTPREYPVTIKNVGRTETGKITLALPNWIQAVTPSEMASLAQGDSATILLRFIPTEAMKLNVRVSGNIGINCANGDGTSIGFHLTPVSEEKGKLKVDVVDEYTYFTAEAPHVSKAKVKVKNPSTNEVVAEGETVDDGTFEAELPEGYYSVTVDADKHDSYANTVIVDPGVEKNEEVFLSYQAITYSWDVEETGVEDEYEIETIVKYETRVPKPVVIITLPDEQPEPNSIIPVVITNKGLVNALDFNLSLSANDGYTLEFLNDQKLDVLAPQQSHVFYAKLVPSGNEEAEARIRKASRIIRCVYIIARGHYKEPCEKNPGTETTVMEKRWGRCTGNGGSGIGGNGGNGGYAPGYSPGGWGNTYINDYYIIDYLGDPAKNCDGTTPRNNSDAPVNPVNRDKVDNGNPEELPCDSKEEPKLVYKLVPVSGERYEMNGVAADGVSQVKIVLDPKQSSIPSQDCDKFYGFSWVLIKDGDVVEDKARFGSIEKISDWEAIYTAPSYFTEEYGSVTTVEAQLWYRHKDPTLPDEYEGWLEKAPRVIIEIVRPPVVFIHGLGSNRSCWYNAEKYLTETGYYKKRFNYRLDYRETNASTFMSNVGVVSDGIYKARERAATLGYVATKCDLIGHSMGGILARLFVERSGRTANINRIITVNTPHSGSELGDIVTAHSLVLKALAKWKYGKDDIDAVEDLGVESDEMNLLVNVPGHFNIPCYAIGTQSDLRGIILAGGAHVVTELSATAFAASLAGVIADPEPVTKTLLAVVSLITGELALEGRHLLDDYVQVGEGDLVVSSESQLGGCEASELIEHGPWHCNSTKDYKVINRIKELLKIPSSDPTFSTNWFNPKKRSFNHASGWQLWGQRILNVLLNATPSYLWKDLISAGASEWSFLDNVTFKCEVLTNTIHKAPATKGAVVASTQERVLKINVDLPNELTNVMSCIYLNGHLAYILQGEDNEFTIPSTYSGEVSVKILLKDSNDNLYSDERILNIETPLATAVSIEADDIDAIEGKDTYLSLECIWDDGSRTFVKADNVEFEDNSIASYSDGIIKGIKGGKTNATITYAGFSCSTDIFVYPSNIVDDEDSDDSPSICSTVTLSFKQKNVMTRQAFRGTLTVNNGNETTAMKDVKMNLEVRDMDGNMTTSHEFQIDAESLNGFTGNLDFTSGWTLEANGTGVATILFIPTKYAAPTEPKDYSFGGSFSYTDPYTGLTVTRDLNPVTLTVNPSPNLEMTYFMQRDVFGDDPLTETVEPMIPSEFALIVNNKGYGDAENMSLTTHQPEIIDNQKGLAISFELISTQLNGGDKNLSLGGSMTSDFGTIPAHSQAYAQWWLQSSLLGHFIEYDVKATHLTSRNNPDLSLLDTVTVHELIHGFTVRNDGDKPLRGFLVNDIKDKEDLPDEVYFTDATQQGAYITTNANIIKQSDTEYVLNVNAGNSGWNYGSLLDPTYGKQKLVKVTRADGAEVNVDNIWQTSCTLRDGKDPLYEKRLHFVGNMPAGGETFYLTFEPKPELELEVESYAGVPEEGTVLKEQLTELTVKFNKPIKVESFTTEDITINCQGVVQDASQMVIEQVNESEFKLKLNEVTLFDGYYVLNVQTSDIEDNEGFTGTTGKQASWIQFLDGKVALKLTASPADGGTISPASGRFDYDSDVTLKATAAEGYDFVGWSLDGETVSDNSEFSHHLTADTELKALFTIRHYDVAIECDETQGSVSNAASGIYDFGTLLKMTAVPQPDFVFVGWVINGETVADVSSTLTVTVDKALNIRAEFARNVYHQSITMEYGWNWMSTYMGEPIDINEVIPYANRIVGQFDELIFDPQYGMVGGLDSFQPGKAYKIEAKTNFTKTFSGHIYHTESMPISLKTGWNWIAYPYTEKASVGSVITNASEGDYIATQTGFAEYSDGYWEGTLNMFEPGMGYLYKSTTDKDLVFDFTSIDAHENRIKKSNTTAFIDEEIDVHRYPNTMNLTVRLIKDGTEQTGGNYIVYAIVNNELRGISQYIGNNYFITVYGDKPVDITFICVSTETGRSFVANETIQFLDDVIGSRKSPFAISFGDVTGIEQWDRNQKPITVYSLEGILIGRNMTHKMLKKLPKGLYIVNGQKLYVK